MKTKKMVFSLLVTVGLVMSLALGAQAAQGWFVDYSVTLAGPQEIAAGVTVNQIAIQLQKVGGTPATFNAWATVGREREILATALTALANGKKVDALIDDALVNGRVVIRNLLVKP